MQQLSDSAKIIIQITSEYSLTEAISMLKREIVRIKLAERRNNVSAVSRDLNLDRHSVIAYRNQIYAKRNTYEQQDHLA
jgi:hypothetical protein